MQKVGKKDQVLRWQRFVQPVAVRRVGLGATLASRLVI